MSWNKKFVKGDKVRIVAGIGMGGTAVVTGYSPSGKLVMIRPNDKRIRDQYPDFKTEEKYFELI